MTRLAITLATLALLLTGCSADPRTGYSFRSPYDSSITTVAVPVFANSTQHTGIETDVTDAIIKELQRETPWRVTQSETADAVLRGRVISVRLLRLSQQSGVGLVQEQGVQVNVSFELVDNRRGETLIARQGFGALASFVPAQPTGERISVGYRGAAEILADDIVTELANSW
ncbi:MAG: LptE family protein [Planctomycetota bacterium]